MNEDDIDDFVDRLFRNAENRSNPSPGPLGYTGNGDWRLDRIDQTIHDAYEDAIHWHEARIAEGTCPRCGLNNTKGDHRCMAGLPPLTAEGTGLSSFERNGIPRVAATVETQRSGMSCAEAMIILVVGLAMLIFMWWWSGGL